MVTNIIQIDKALPIFPLAFNLGYLNPFHLNHFGLLSWRVAAWGEQCLATLAAAHRLD